MALGEPRVVPRVSDIYSAVPSITGKLELEYEGELQGGDAIARELGARRRLRDQHAEPRPDVLQQLDEQVPLRREVLVQHRLGHARRLGHVIHRRPMETVLCEDLTGDVEQLASALMGGEADGHVFA